MIEVYIRCLAIKAGVSIGPPEYSGTLLHCTARYILFLNLSSILHVLAPGPPMLLVMDVFSSALHDDTVQATSVFVFVLEAIYREVPLIPCVEGSSRHAALPTSPYPVTLDVVQHTETSIFSVPIVPSPRVSYLTV